MQGSRILNHSVQNGDQSQQEEDTHDVHAELVRSADALKDLLVRGVREKGRKSAGGGGGVKNTTNSNEKRKYSAVLKTNTTQKTTAVKLKILLHVKKQICRKRKDTYHYVPGYKDRFDSLMV